MKKVTVKNIKWDKKPTYRTKKEFDDGLSEFNYTPTIEIEIPVGVDPMITSALVREFYGVGNKNKAIVFNQTGYNVANNILYLKTNTFFESPIETIEIYYI